MTDQPIETITAPDPANVRLDPRLMTAGRLVELAGYREVVFTPTESGLYIDCAECHRGITSARLTTGVQLMADVLRHYVNVHNVSLSGGRPT